MSNCMGERTLSAKVDQEMREYIEEQADERAITPSEFLRRLLDLYRTSERGELTCAHCDQGIYIGQGV